MRVTVEEDWHVMVVIEQLWLDLPGDHVTRSLVVDRNWEVSTLVEAAELGVGWVSTLGECTSLNRAWSKVTRLAQRRRRS